MYNLQMYNVQLILKFNYLINKQNEQKQKR